MRDFTLDIYRELLERMEEKGYALISYSDYCKGKRPEKYVILRHDVDAKPENSLKTAQIEHSLGAKASYYFRKPTPEIIRAIVGLGHEIGYHYEDLSLCGGDVDKAWVHFQTWLDYYRQFYAVETICMHGSPMSRWDNRDLWQTYDYRSLGIIGEPYIDTDFEDVFYLTDTGRCWDGYRFAVRDKITKRQDEWRTRGWLWHGTRDLLRAIDEEALPPRVLMTTHPQRWTNNTIEWYKEYIQQTIKNGIKFCINRRRGLYRAETYKGNC